MNTTPPIKALASAVAALAFTSTAAFAVPITSNSDDFLMIGMGNSASTDDAINVNSSEELGANSGVGAIAGPLSRR